MLNRHPSRSSGVPRVDSRASSSNAELKVAEDEIAELQARVKKLQTTLRTTKQNLEEELEQRDDELGAALTEIEELKASIMADKMAALSQQDDEFAQRMEELTKRRREVDAKLKTMTTQHKAALRETVCFRTISHSRIVMNTYFYKMLKLVSGRRYRLLEEQLHRTHQADQSTIEDLNRKLAESVFSSAPNQFSSLIANLHASILTLDADQNRAGLPLVEQDLRSALKCEADWLMLQREYEQVAKEHLREKISAAGCEAEVREVLNDINIQWDDKEGLQELRRAQEAIQQLTSKLEMQTESSTPPASPMESPPMSPVLSTVKSVQHTIVIPVPDCCSTEVQTDPLPLTVSRPVSPIHSLLSSPSSVSSNQEKDTDSLIDPLEPSLAQPPVQPTPLRGHDGRPLPGYTVAVDNTTALTPAGTVILASDGRPVQVDEAGWPCDSSGQPLKLFDVGGGLICLSVSQLVHNGCPIFVSTEGEHYLENGTNIVLHDGKLLVDDEGYLVTKQRDNSGESFRTEDGKVAVVTDGQPVVWENSKAAVANDGTLTSPVGGTIEAPDGLPVKVTATGHPVTASGTPVVLLTHTHPPMAMVAHPQTGLFVDCDKHLRTSSGDVVVTKAGKPLRSKTNELVVIPKETGIPVLESGMAVLLKDVDTKEVLLWEDGTPVMVSSDGKHVIGRDGKRVHGVRVSEDHTAVTFQGVQATLVCLEDGRTAALVPVEGEQKLFRNIDGELCTVNGAKVAQANGAPLTSHDGCFVVEEDTVHGVGYELEDGRRVAVDAEGQVLSLDGRVCTVSDDGRVVVDTFGTPLVGPDSRPCLFSDDNKVMTSRKVPVQLGTRDGCFVALIKDGEYFVDRAGDKCLASGLKVETCDNGDVLKASNGASVLKEGITTDGMLVTSGRWKDGSVVVANSKKEILDKNENAIEGLRYEEDAIVFGDGERVLLFDDNFGNIVIADEGAGDALIHENNLIKARNSHLYTQAGDRVHSIGGVPLLHGTMPVLSSLQGLHLADGRTVAMCGEMPLKWNSGAPVLCDLERRMLNEDGSPEERCRAMARGDLCWDGTYGATVANNEVVIKKRDGLFCLPSGEQCTEDGLLVLPITSTDGRHVLASINTLEDGTPVALKEDNEVLTWPSGHAVICSNAGAVLDPKGGLLLGLLLDKNKHLMLDSGEHVSLSLDETNEPVVLIPMPHASNDLYTDMKGVYRTSRGRRVALSEGQPLTDNSSRLVTRSIAGVLATDDNRLIAVHPDGQPILSSQGTAISSLKEGSVVPDVVFNNLPVSLSVTGHPVTASGTPVVLLTHTHPPMAMVAHPQTGLFVDCDKHLRTSSGDVVVTKAGKPLRSKTNELVVIPKETGIPVLESGMAVLLKDVDTKEVLLWEDGTPVMVSSDGKHVIGRDGKRVHGVRVSEDHTAVTFQGVQATLVCLEDGRTAALVPVEGEQKLFRNIDGELCTVNGAKVAQANGAPLTSHDGCFVVEEDTVHGVGYELEDGRRVAVDAEGQVLSLDGRVCTVSDDGRVVVDTFGTPLVGPDSRPCLFSDDNKVMTSRKVPVQLGTRDGCFVALIKDGEYFVDRAGDKCLASGLKVETCDNGDVLKASNGASVLKEGITTDGMLVTSGRWKDGSVIVADEERNVLGPQLQTLPGITVNTNNKLLNHKGVEVKLVNTSEGVVALEDMGSGVFMYGMELFLEDGSRLLMNGSKPFTSADGKMAALDVNTSNLILVTRNMKKSTSGVVIQTTKGIHCLWEDSGYLVVGNKSGEVLDTKLSIVNGIRHAEGVVGEGVHFAKGVAMMPSRHGLFRHISDEDDIRTATGDEVVVQDGRVVRTDSGVAAWADKQIVLYPSMKRVATMPNGKVLRKSDGSLVLGSSCGKVEGIPGAYFNNRNNLVSKTNADVVLLEMDSGKMTPATALEAQPGMYQALDCSSLLDSKGQEIIDVENKVALAPEGPVVVGTDRKVALTVTGEILKTNTGKVVSYSSTVKGSEVYVGDTVLQAPIRINTRGRVEDNIIIINDEVVLVPEKVFNGVQLYTSTEGELVTHLNEKVAVGPSGSPLSTSDGKLVLASLALLDGTPIGLEGYATPFIFEGHAVIIIDGIAMHKRQPLIAAGKPVHANRHNVLVTEEGKVTVANDYMLLVEVKDVATGNSIFYDQERVPRTQHGGAVSLNGGIPVVAEGQLVVVNKDNTMHLEDGTEVVNDVKWSDGMPVTCMGPGPGQSVIRTRDAQPLLGPDGKEVVVVKGSVYTSDKRQLLELKMDPGDCLTVLAKSVTYPSLYTDNAGRLCTKEGVCVIRNGEPLMSADGSFIIKTASGVYSRCDGRGKVIMKKGTMQPLTWADGIVAVTDDLLLRSPDGRLVEGVKISPSGRVVNHEGQEVDVVLQPSGMVVCITPHGCHWRDAFDRLCTKAGELIATTDGVPITAADGSVVLHSNERNSAAPRYVTGGNGSPVACTSDGKVALWDTGNAMVCGSDGKTLLNPKGEPVHGVVISKEGKLMNKSGEEVVVVPTDPPMLLREYQGHYMDEVGVLRVKDGRAILLNAHGVPYYSKNQVVVRTNADVTMEDGTRVALRGDGTPLTWPDGAVVTQVQGMSIVKGTLVHDTTKRKGSISLRGTPVLHRHDTLWERGDGSLCLLDDRTVYTTKEGNPVRGAGGYLLGDVNKLEDGTPVAMQYGEPLLWNSNEPAVVGLDRKTLLDSARVPITGPDGRFVVVTEDGSLQTPNGQDVIITIVDDAPVAMTQKRDLQGKICRVGGRTLFSDQTGATRLEQGEEVILVDDQPVQHAGGFVIKAGGRLSISGALNLTVVNNAKGQPVVWKDGTAMTSTGGKVDGVPGVYTSPKGQPLDKHGNSIVLHLGKEGDMVPLVSSNEHSGLFTSLYEPESLFTEAGHTVVLGTNGWPLKDHQGRTVISMGKADDILYKTVDGITVVKARGAPLTTPEGTAMIRSPKGLLDIGKTIMHEVQVTPEGKLVSSNTGLPCMLVFKNEERPLVLTPVLDKEGHQEATPYGEMLWKEQDAESMHTEDGNEVFIINGTVVLKKGHVYRTEDGRKVSVISGQVITWHGTGKVVTTQDERSNVIEGPDGRAVESAEGKVILNFKGEPSTLSGKVVKLAERGPGAVGLVYATTYKGRVLYQDPWDELCLENGDAVLLGMDGEPLQASSGKLVLSNLLTEDGSRVGVDDGGKPLQWENGSVVVSLKGTNNVLNDDGTQPVSKVHLADDSRVVTERNEQAWLVSSKGECYGLTPLRDPLGDHSVLPDGRLLFKDPQGAMCLRSGTPVQRGTTPLNTSVNESEWKWTSGFCASRPMTPQDRVFASPLKDISVNTTTMPSASVQSGPVSKAERTLRSQLSTLSEKLEAEKLERMKVGANLKMEKMKMSSTMDRVMVLKEFANSTMQPQGAKDVEIFETHVHQTQLEERDDALSLSPIVSDPSEEQGSSFQSPQVEVKLHVTPNNPSTITQYTTARAAHLEEWDRDTDLQTILNPCVTLDEFS